MPKKKSDLPVGVYRKKDSPLLWVHVKRQGKTHYRPAHTQSVQQALLVRDLLLREVIAGERPHAGVGNVTCKLLLDNYLDRLEKKPRNEDCETFTITRGTVHKHLMPFFGNRKANLITRKVLETYRAKKLEDGLSQVSVNRHLGYLRTSFNLGRKDKLTNHAPDFSTSIDDSAEDENMRTGVITREQYTRLVGCFADDLHVLTLFVFCWNTGVRPIEAFRLKWDQVDWEKGLMRIFKKQGKTKQMRFLPLVTVVLQQLATWKKYLGEHWDKAEYVFTHPIKGVKMTKTDYRSPWKNALKRAGYSGLLFYDSRRSFRTFLPSEVNPADGQSVIGHDTNDSYMRYLDKERAALRVRESLERENATAVPAPSGDVIRTSYEKIAALKELTALLTAGHISTEEFQLLKAGL